MTQTINSAAENDSSLADRLEVIAARLEDLEARIRASEIREPSEHKRPAVRVRATTDAERTQALAEGIEALEQIIAIEEQKLALLHGVLAIAGSCALDPAKLEDRALMNRLTDQLNVLGKGYIAGLLDPTNVTGDIDQLACTFEAKLGLVSGRELFVSGGDISELDDFLQTEVDHIRHMVDEYGIAEGAELLEAAG